MAAGAPAARVRARVAHFALASDLTLALICTQLCQTHSVNTATSEASTETNAGHARSQCHDWDHRTNRETRLELAGRQVLHAFAIEAIRMKPEMTKARMAAAQVCCWCKRVC